MRDDIIVVSGLPRSGTSMMMRMLEAGGIPIFTDRVREADPDNPRGYYEYEPVKCLDKDASWVGKASGHALKVISSLLKYLPAEHAYSVIFITRDIEEVLASQQAMLHRRVEQKKLDESAVAPERLAKEHDLLLQTYTRHVHQTLQWIAAQPNMRSLQMEHRDALQNPQQAASAVNKFLGGSLDAAAMADAVEQRLYRQRKQTL